jgi:hypothetical protein
MRILRGSGYDPKTKEPMAHDYGRPGESVTTGVCVTTEVRFSREMRPPRRGENAFHAYPTVDVLFIPISMSLTREKRYPSDGWFLRDRIATGRLSGSAPSVRDSGDTPDSGKKWRVTKHIH